MLFLVTDLSIGRLFGRGRGALAASADVGADDAVKLNEIVTREGPIEISSLSDDECVQIEDAILRAVRDRRDSERRKRKGNG